MDAETAKAMKDAIAEIRRLRRTNEVLQAKVDTVGFLETVLHAKALDDVAGRLVAEDVASKLQHLLDVADGAE